MKEGSLDMTVWPHAFLLQEEKQPVRQEAPSYLCLVNTGIQPNHSGQCLPKEVTKTVPGKSSCTSGTDDSTHVLPNSEETSKGGAGKGHSGKRWVGKQGLVSWLCDEAHYSKWEQKCGTDNQFFQAVPLTSTHIIQSLPPNTIEQCW